jgi:hypothetical protein
MADCGAWSVDGYHLGMTISEASEVRAAKERHGMLKVQKKGRFKGFLKFDDQGRLIEWIAVLKNVEHDDLKENLVERLGSPAVDERFCESNHIGPKFSTSWETDWINQDCHTLIRLRHENIKVYDDNSLQVDTDRVSIVLVDPEIADEIEWSEVE